MMIGYMGALRKIICLVVLGMTSYLAAQEMINSLERVEMII